VGAGTGANRSRSQGSDTSGYLPQARLLQRRRPSARSLTISAHTRLPLAFVGCRDTNPLDAVMLPQQDTSLLALGARPSCPTSVRPAKPESVTSIGGVTVVVSE